MKKIFYLLSILTCLIACKDSTRFTIKGKFENFGADRKVFLYGMADNNMKVLDSTVLSDKGEFKFNNSSPDGDFYRVNIGANEYMAIAKNGDEVTLNADLTSKDQQYQLSGNDESEKLMEFYKLKGTYTTKIDAIKNDFERKVAAEPEKREALVEQLSPVYMKAIDELNGALLKFANDNSNSLVSFYVISSINPTGNEDAMVAYAAKVGDDLKKNAAVKSFIDKVAKLKSLLVGQQAPDFSIPSIDGKTISLNDFKGKYTLIDFWASWCAPCRNENPNVVKAYNKYKSRGFTILGISLDKDKSAWKQAIAQDGLIWAHAGELADFAGPTVRLYQVEAIPASFLIGPDGKILAKNLRGDELDAFLNKTLP